jgi:tRNA-dihydrouridine synthase A
LRLGLSPKQENPRLTVVLNGIGSVAEVERHCMFWTASCSGRGYRSWLLAELQSRLFAKPGPASRETAVAALTDYLGQQVGLGVPVKHVCRHALGLFQGQPGARRWRRYLSQHAHLEPDNGELLLQALAQLRGAEGGSAPVHGDVLQWAATRSGRSG